MWRSLRNGAEFAFAGVAYLYARTLGHTMNPCLTPIEPSTRLSPLVHRVLGANPGPFTLRGTNTYLVGAGPSRVLIDTGDRNVAEYITELRNALGESTITCIICTHWHEDHVGGVPNVIEKVIGKSVPVYKFKREDAPEDASRYEYVNDGHVVRLPDATLRLMLTPGHTTEHMAIYLEEEQTLFSGDCILGEGTSIFEDLYSYMQSLQKLLALKPLRIFPGHGPVIENPVEKITDYIAHRNERENQILDVLRHEATSTSMDITTAVYKDLSWALKLAALSNVNHHLSKLVKEKKIAKIGVDTYWLCSESK